MTAIDPEIMPVVPIEPERTIAVASPGLDYRDDLAELPAWLAFERRIFVKTNAALFTWLHFVGQVTGVKLAARLFAILTVGLNAFILPRFELADLARKVAKAGINLDLVYVATRNRVVFGANDIQGLRDALGVSA